MLIVVIGLFIAGLTACLCGRLIRSALHGMADNDDGHGDDATHLRVLDYVATRLRVCGGICRTPLTDVRLGASRACVRALDLAAWLAGVGVLDGSPGASCWWRSRRWRPRCCGTGGRGWAWVGRCAGRWQCSVSIVLCRVVVRKNETAAAASFVCLLV
jgi:hypothetical protein